MVVNISNSVRRGCCMSITMSSAHVLIWATSNFREKLFEPEAKLDVCLGNHTFQYNFILTMQTCQQ